MQGDELTAWLGSIFPGMKLTQIGERPCAQSTLSGLPVAVTVGFSGVDTGLVMQEDSSTEVRCEIVCRAATSPDTLAEAVVTATRMIESGGLPARPGTLLPGLFDSIVLPESATVRHGLLRAPELFERGTPLYNEPGRMTLLVELIALDDDELSIAAERGYPVLETRLRRRGVRVVDWSRDV